MLCTTKWLDYVHIICEKYIFTTIRGVCIRILPLFLQPFCHYTTITTTLSKGFLRKYFQEKFEKVYILTVLKNGVIESRFVVSENSEILKKTVWQKTVFHDFPPHRNLILELDMVACLITPSILVSRL